MYDWSEQYQQDIYDAYGSTCENNDLQDQLRNEEEQPLSLSNRSITTTSTISENTDKNYSQQLRETHVTVNLFDCMQCYVRAPRCEVGQQSHDFNTETPTEFDLRIQELPANEVEKMASPSQRNEATSQEEEEEEDEEFYGEGLDVEEFDPWKHFIYSQ